MALLFIDGFDHYATADLTKKWTSNTSCTVLASSGRRSAGALSHTTGSVLLKSIPATTSFIIGFAFNVSAAPGASRTLCVLNDAGTAQCNIMLNNDLTMSVTRNGSAVTNGTSVLSFTTNTWYYVEWKVTIADSIGAGSCVVKVNGTTWITVATGQDLKNTSNTTATQFSLGDTSSHGGTWLFDDLYIGDQSGSSPLNDLLGDCRIDALYANADGSNSAFTCSTGSTHYTLVDETAPNTSDYNESSTPNDKDTYAFQNLSTITGTIFGIQVSNAVLKDDAGTRTVANTIKSGATNADGVTVGPSTSQLYFSDIWSLDPNTSAAWTESNINAIEAGLKIIS